MGCTLQKSVIQERVIQCVTTQEKVIQYLTNDIFSKECDASAEYVSGVVDYLVSEVLLLPVMSHRNDCIDMGIVTKRRYYLLFVRLATRAVDDAIRCVYTSDESKWTSKKELKVRVLWKFADPVVRKRIIKKVVDVMVAVPDDMVISAVMNLLMELDKKCT